MFSMPEIPYYLLFYPMCAFFKARFCLQIIEKFISSGWKCILYRSAYSTLLLVCLLDISKAQLPVFCFVLFSPAPSIQVLLVLVGSMIAFHSRYSSQNLSWTFLSHPIFSLSAEPVSCTFKISQQISPHFLFSTAIGIFQIFITCLIFEVVF